MQDQLSHSSGRDPYLWAIARKRASFKTHFTIYLLVNAFLWALWFFSVEKKYIHNAVPWPLFTTLGWGIGITFHFLRAYVYPKNNRTEREYEKLMREKNNR